jgi:sporulation protein YlmC with PRC-barrel domain
MIEKRVIDSEGTELGVVSKVEDDYIEVSEGLFDELLLKKSFIGKEKEEEVILKDNLHNLLVGLEVVDSKDKNIGKILEEILAGDVLDSLIIDTQDSDLLFITLEEIYKIDEQMKLDIDLEEIKYRQKTHAPQDHIKHYLERKRSH